MNWVVGWKHGGGVLVALLACASEPPEKGSDSDEDASEIEEDEASDDEHGVLPEIQVSRSEIVDFEFDWGRDGIHCPSCNEDDGNSRFVFTDREQNLWLGYVDPETGDFEPPDGRAVWLDDNAAFATDFGNGPEWMFSTGSSEIVYTKYEPGARQTTLSAAVALATPSTTGEWTAGLMPVGARSQSPSATLDLDDPSPRINYQDHRKENVYWLNVGDPEAPGTPTLLPIAEQTGGGSRRWVPGRRALVFSGSAAPDASGTVYQQVFFYDTDSGELEQLTFDATTKWGAFMWRAPEFDDEYVFFTVADRTQIRVYRLLSDDDGAPTWTEVVAIDAPPTLPYIWSPEPFVYNGKSYIFMQISSNPQASDFGTPTQIALTGVEPELPSFRMLTNDSSVRRVRMDPEFFVTEEGAFIYYNRYVPPTADTPMVVNDGVWRVDTRLGPPEE
jgi:hypothetical protein